MNAHLKEYIAPPKAQTIEATDLNLRTKAIIDALQSGDIPDYDKNIILKATEEFCSYSEAMHEIRNIPKVTIFGGARVDADSAEYKMTKELGEIMSNFGYKIITGAGPGIMEAGHEGATSKHAVGYAVELPFEESTNIHVRNSKYLVKCKYLFTRKVMLLRETNAVVCVKPGFGTMDELFEILTLIKTGKNPPIPVVLLQDDKDPVWDSFLQFCKTLEKSNTISADDLHTFVICNSVQEASEYIYNFYRKYHSVKFVEDKTVIRLKSPLDAEVYSALCQKYADFLGSEGLVYSESLLGEKDEVEIQDLPRLVMKNAKSEPSTLYKLIVDLNKNVEDI